MPIGTFAILMPGNMDHGCAIDFRKCGFRVMTKLEGHGVRTFGQKEIAQMEELGLFEAATQQANLILFTLPPESTEVRRRRDDRPGRTAALCRLQCDFASDIELGRCGN